MRKTVGECRRLSLPIRPAEETCEGRDSRLYTRFSRSSYRHVREDPAKRQKAQIVQSCM